MRKYCFQEKTLSRGDIEDIEELTNKIREEEKMIGANRRQVEECNFCKASRKTIEDCHKLIKKFLKELENTYGIKEYLL